jgi:hypothetical protein
MSDVVGDVLDMVEAEPEVVEWPVVSWLDTIEQDHANHKEQLRSHIEVVKNVLGGVEAQIAQGRGGEDVTQMAKDVRSQLDNLVADLEQLEAN